MDISRVDNKVPKCKTTEQANSISIYVYITIILFACVGSFAFCYLGSDPVSHNEHIIMLPYVADRYSTVGITNLLQVQPLVTELSSAELTHKRGDCDFVGISVAPQKSTDRW